MEGWIKLHRKFLEWEWFKMPEMVQLFIFLLISANHEVKKWQGIEIKRGEYLTGRESLSLKTGLSQQVIRTCLNRLKSTSEITIKSTNKYSIISICKYDSYQYNLNDANQQINQQTNQQSTSNQPATNQQLTTNKNEKNNKNEIIKEKDQNLIPENQELPKSDFIDLIIQEFVKVGKANKRDYEVLAKGKERKMAGNTTN